MWLCSTVLGSWPKGCEFDHGSRQLLDERGSALSLSFTSCKLNYFLYLLEDKTLPQFHLLFSVSCSYDLQKLFRIIFGYIHSVLFSACLCFASYPDLPIRTSVCFKCLIDTTQLKLEFCPQWCVCVPSYYKSIDAVYICIYYISF